jgi:hypothetical protein
MPVQIDHIDTEIEFGPSQPDAEARRPVPAPAMPAPAMQRDRRSVLAVLEAELDQYMRMRG